LVSRSAPTKVRMCSRFGSGAAGWTTGRAAPEPKRLHIRTFVGAERDTNIAKLDVGAPFPAQLKQKGDWRAILEARAIYYMVAQQNAYLAVLGEARGSFHRVDSNYDDALFGTSIFGAYTFGAWRAGGEARYDRSLVDYSGYSKQWNLTGWGSHRFNPQHEMVMTYRFRTQAFDAVEIDTRRDRDGKTSYVSVSHLWRPYTSQSGIEFFEVEPGARWGWERTDGGYFDNNEWAVFFSLRYQKAIVTRPTLLEAGVFYYEQDFTQGAIQVAINPARNVRHDTNFSQWVRVTQPVNNYLSIEGTYRHVANNTNVFTFGNKSHIYRLGVVGNFAPL